MSDSMLGPRLTFREITIPIAVIASLIAYWVLNPWASAFVSTASIPVAVGFVIGYLVRHGDQKIDGYSMMSPPILLILIHAGFGVACFALTIFIPGSLSLGFSALVLSVVFAIPTLLGYVIYQVSQRSLRFRLTVEILTLLAVLALSAWIWRPQHLLQAAEHADAFAAQVSEWAERPNDPMKRGALRRESEWFRRRALSLRRQAIWYGLIHGSHGRDEYYAYDTEDLVHELGILEVTDAHEMRASQDHEGQDARSGP